MANWAPGGSSCWKFKLEIYYLVKRSAWSVLFKKRTLHETPFDDLASGTEIALVKKLLLQDLVMGPKRGSRGGLENENSDIIVMFCPRSPDLKVYLIY